MKRESLWEDWIGDDGIHLNTEGHNWIYQKVSNWGALNKWANELD